MRSKMKEYKDILIDLPLVNQKTETKDPKWARRSCGICSLKMVVYFYHDRGKNTPRKTKTHEFSQKIKSVDTLIKEGLKHNAYLEGIGWKHDGLIKIASDNGVRMSYQKNFFKKLADKRKRLIFIERNIRTQKPVIVSMFSNLNPHKGGHLVVMRGLRLSGKRVLGYYIQDPYPLKRGSKYFVTKKEFLKGWRGGMLWLK